MTIICVKNIRTSNETFYQSIESLFENVKDIKCKTRNGAENASIEWVKAEMAKNGVASIHTIEPAFEFCGTEFPAVISEFVISCIDVK